MNALIKQKLIYCSECHSWKRAGIDTYLNVLFEESVTCSEDHLVGRTCDKEWNQIFPIHEDTEPEIIL